MAITVNIVEHWSDTKRIFVTGTVVFSGNYVTGGDTINFGLPLIKSARAPFVAWFAGLAQFLYNFIPGSTITNGKVKIIVSNTGAEQAAGAYPAGITGDVIQFEAQFKKFR